MAGTRFKPVPVLVIKNNGKLGFVQITPVRVHVPTRGIYSRNWTDVCI